MKQFLLSSLIKTLAIGNGFPTGMTDRNNLQALLRRLHPVSSDKGLIRLGPKGDGGYLVPDDLAGIEACFSPGVSTSSGFEIDCAELGMQVFLADKSVNGPAADHKLFHFTKKYIGTTSNDEFMTLDYWVDSSLPGKNSDLLLQIDIENYEYEVFLSTSEVLLQRFRIIVAEFHLLDQLWSKPFFSLAGRAFDKILQTHTCVHIHPNNCCSNLKKSGLDIPPVMEFTFLRNDRIKTHFYQNVFPNPLDCDNFAAPGITLPKCWFREK